MRLQGEQFAAMQAALHTAYPTPAMLRQMLRVRLETDLAYVAGGANYRDVLFNLITWAESEGRVEELLDEALADKPGNADLRRFVEAFRAAAPAGEEAAAIDAFPAVAPTPVVVEEAPPRDELVGRVELVGVLRSELEQVNATRRGRSLVLLGERGVGKTRLAECAVGAARELDVLVLEADCYGAGSEPLLPLRESLKSYFARSPIEEVVNSSPALREHVRFLGSFLTIDETGIGGPQLGGQTEQGTYLGLAEVLVSLAGRHGLCLVVEDLTEADDATLHFLDFFRRKAADSRVLTIFTVKQDLLPESQLHDRLDRWIGPAFSITEVPPLERDDACKLISMLWKGERLSAERIAAIAELTEGNPFFIEQYVGLRLDDPSFDADAEVPPTVRWVLEQRLRRLDDDDRGFLDAAAVALESSDRLDLIADVAEIDMKEARRLLRAAVQARYLTQDAKGGISFTQELLRRVVYEALDGQTREQMHTSAAQWLEETGLFASAAHHYNRAERRDDLVRAALGGAEHAEHAGLYRTAVQLYELAQPYADLQTIGPRLAEVYLVVGEWPKAEEVLDRLPADAPRVRLLRSEVRFVCGDFDQAREEVELALETPSEYRLDALIRLADINLYLGDLPRAAEHANEALAEARGAAAVARCTGIVGACAFFSGDVDEGERRFIEAMTLLSSQPLEERDPVISTTLLENLASVSEVRGQWKAAKRLHEEALTKRREVSDARGVLQSLHALARSDLALGSVDAGLQSLEQARALAGELGDRLEQGKLEHTYVDVELQRGNPAAAVGRAEAALKRFRKANTAYDIAHARFSLAGALAANGDDRRALGEAAGARLATERKGFALLATLFPELAFSYGDRVATGLLGYAYGDAVGLPWEGRSPAHVDADRIPELPATGDWATGDTSDDTQLTFLVAESLASSDGADVDAFTRLLTERGPSIRGLGPSTTKAIEHLSRTGTPPTGDGNTNGALMRSLPIGWALPLDCVDERRAWTTALSRTTHPGPEACCAALVGAALASWAIEGAEPALLLDVAREEATAAVESCAADPRIGELLGGLAAGSWQPDPASTGLDPYETLARVLWCVLEEPWLPDALLAAVRLGGDTDTVAALVGGLLGCRLAADEVREQVPWSGLVQLPDGADVAGLASGLAALRIGRADG